MEQFAELVGLIVTVVTFVATVIIRGKLFIAQQLFFIIRKQPIIFEFPKLIISITQQFVNFRVLSIYLIQLRALIFSSLQPLFLVRSIFIFPSQLFQQALSLFTSELPPLP